MELQMVVMVLKRSKSSRATEPLLCSKCTAMRPGMFFEAGDGLHSGCLLPGTLLGQLQLSRKASFCRIFVTQPLFQQPDIGQSNALQTPAAVEKESTPSTPTVAQHARICRYQLHIHIVVFRLLINCVACSGVVDCATSSGSVELKRYPKSHPFAQLSGSDNIIAFTTQRYSQQPLIIRYVKQHCIQGVDGKFPACVHSWTACFLSQAFSVVHATTAYSYRVRAAQRVFKQSGTSCSSLACTTQFAALPVYAMLY